MEQLPLPLVCSYCRDDGSVYDISCLGCRARFRFDHLRGKWKNSKRLLYVLEPNTPILKISEDPS